MTSKYSVWWHFKPNSLLKIFLEREDQFTKEFFCPEEILQVVMEVIERKTPYQNSGNNNILYLNNELQRIFNTWIIYVPELIDCIMQQIEVMDMDALQSKYIAQELYLPSPTQLIYKDETSLFWLHPVVNYMLNENKFHTYSWNTLLNKFIEFCTTNTTCFTQINDTLISINDNTPLTPLFKFQLFHVSQCEALLKQITKYLGRQNTIATACPYLKLSKTDSNVHIFIDDVINNNHALLPQFPPYFYL